MSELVCEEISSIAEFLAHALELESESAERYRELADNLQVHNNPEVAALFRKLADESDSHADEVRHRCEGVALPTLAPWDFKWTCPEGPESTSMDDAHYLMTRCDALTLALHNERRGRDFYAQVAACSKDPEVRRVAAEMADEEGRHVGWIEAWLDSEPQSTQPALEDLDPAHMPE